MRIMPSASPPVSEGQAEQLGRLGEHLRAARRQQKVSATAAAEAAGMSRVTWHRIERGEASVTMGAWLAAAEVLGLRFDWVDPAATVTLPLGEKVALADYPQLRQLAWQTPDLQELTPQEALALYERNWRHVDRQALTLREIALIHALASTLGGGRLLV